MIHLNEKGEGVMASKKSAVFVDLENMAGGETSERFDISNVMQSINKISIPVLKRSYGDWGRFARYRDDFTGESFDLVQVASRQSGKNGVDIQICVDALEAIFLFPHISLVFIIAGDSDYCPLVRVLRKHEREVIGIGWLASTGKLLHRHCDEFWSYDELVETFNLEHSWIHSNKVKSLLQQVTLDFGSEAWIRLSALKQALCRYDSTFDEKEHGFSCFSQFVKQHPDLQLEYAVSLSDYRVRLPKIA
jgi:uncharacterized LabA/DUF88 family protein